MGKNARERKGREGLEAGAEGAEVLVEVHGLAPGGAAVGRQRGGEHEGRVVFVPLAAPGELVRARLTRERSRLAFGDLVAVERAGSPSVRVEPGCPLFGRCGGCQWQHVSGEAQRAAKGKIVSRALGREDLGPARAVGPEYGYRDRARLTVGERDPATGRRAVGFRAWRSHEVVDVPACPLLGEAAAQSLPVVRESFQDAPTGTQISLQGAAVAVGGRAFEVVGGTLEERPAEEPASWPVVDPGGRVGDATLGPLRVPTGAFAQVGRAANAALLTEVSSALGPPSSADRVLELFAGSGNFTRLLVAHGCQVLVTDGDARAVARGRLNVPGADWREGAALWGSPGDVDIVLVDPPREGLDAASLELAAGARRRVVYVSCDPQTLARDATRLAQRGFELEGAVALDLMPQTHHVEVVATFIRTPMSPAVGGPRT